jgi:hypothetical protein
MLSILALAIAIMQAQPQEIEASSLPSVIGPMVPFDRYVYVRFGDALGQARSEGTIPAVALPGGDLVVNDKMNEITGWKAYRAAVPAGQTVKIGLKAKYYEPWFRVTTVNKWGRPEKGMVLNDFHQLNPGITYTNPSKGAKTVYFVVDTGTRSMSGEKFVLHVTRE